VDWASTLRACNQNLGGRTDESWAESRAYLEIPPPLWGSGPDSAWNRPSVQARLHKKGIVVTGVFVRANVNLRRTAPQDLPGDVVYGLDPRRTADPQALSEVARSVFATQRSRNEDPEVEAMAATLRRETEYFRAFGVPRPLARDLPVLMTTVIVPRKHLPAGILAQYTVPLLVDPDDPGTCMVLPSRYWPAALVDAWKQRPPDPPCADHEQVLVEGYGWPIPLIAIGALCVTQLAVEAITRNENAYKDHPWMPAVGLVVASMALLAFARFDARRQPRRYLQPSCGHPVDVTVDRRVVRLQPRAWGWGLLALAAVFLVKGLIERS
jgi:hypothetical protein